MPRRSRSATGDAELFLRALVDNALDAIIVVEEGLIVFANASAERLLGYDAGTLVGSPLFRIVHQDDWSRMRATMDEAMPRDGRFGPIEHRLVRLGGGSVTCETTASHRRDLGRRPLWILHSRSVTEKKFLEAQLRLAQRMAIVGRTTAAAAHDFNSFLVAVVAYAIQLRAPGATPRVARIAFELNQAAERAAALTRRLLRFARGGDEVGSALSNVNDVVSDLDALLERLVGMDVAIAVRTEAAAPHILMHRSLVEQAIVNLVVNLQETLSAGGEITVATRNAPSSAGDASGDVVIEIAVTRGAGEASTPLPPAGDGSLGLTTALGIIQEAGGRLELESQRGRATRYRVIVPAKRGGADHDEDT